MNKLTWWITGATAIAGSMFTPHAIACPSNPTIAQMCVVGFNFAPRGWAFANGQLLPISQNTTLFSLIGTTYGGDGRTTMQLPDARGRVLIGAGQGPGLSNYRLGQTGGVESVTLTMQNMANHNHSATSTANITVEITGTLQLTGASGRANQASLNANTMARTSGSTRVYAVANGDVPVVDMHADSIVVTLPTIDVNGTGETTLGDAGGSQSHENRAPSLAMHWIIALQGIYPSRS